MKTQTLITTMQGRVTLAFAALLGAVAVLMVATPAYAAVTPSVTVDIRNASNAVVSTVPVGTMVHIRTTVASSTSSTTPAGSVDFIKYNGTICSGTGTTFESNTALVGGVADSAAFAATLGGMSVQAHYDGQGDMFAEATSSCVAVAVNQYAPAVNTTLSSSTVYAGASVYDTATLVGATSTAGGSVAYNVYSNNVCSNLYQSAGTKTVTNATVPNSNSLVFNTPGTYYWQAAYSGDANNIAATSTCASAALTVLATSTPTTTPGTGVISGKVYHDQNKNRKLDAGEPGLSGFTIWLFSKSTKHYKEGNAFMTVVSDTNGNYSFANLPDGKYRVEEKERKSEGWKQITKDFKKVEIKNGSIVGDLNFGNASTTKKHKDSRDDKNDDRWEHFQDKLDSMQERLQSMLQKNPIFSRSN